MKKTLVSLLALCSFTMLLAVPVKPGPRAQAQPDGSHITVYPHGDEVYHYYTDAEGNILTKNDAGYWVKTGETQTAEKILARRAASPRHNVAKSRKVGEANLAPRGLVILVNYTDVTFETDKAEMDSMLTGYNYTRSYSYTYSGTKYSYTCAGSARQYFYDQSAGSYNPQFDVVGPYTVSNNQKYYGGNDSYGNDKKAEYMIKEACELADADGVDFSQYDNDKDGEVDFVYVIYAGYGEADGGGDNTIWPHSWTLKDEAGLTVKLDGKYINLYACGSELSYYSKKHDGIGTFCHEFSHVLGLPDVYDVCYGSNYKNPSEDGYSLTPDTWHIMDGGAYNNDGNTPPNYSCYDKYFLGWLTPTIMNEAENVTLEANGVSCRQVNSNGTLATAKNTSTQYYFENRQQSGWDEHAPGHGMIVWKITYDADIWEANEPNAGTGGDYTPSANTSGKVHYQLISASGSSKVYETQADPFPGSANKTSYTPLSAYPLTEIAENSGVITFKFMGGVEEGVCKALPATNITENQFQANWTDGEVDSYTLNVYTKEATGASVVRDTTFTENTFLSDYDGWTIDNVNLPSALDYVWQQTSSYGMKASAYLQSSSTNYASESWLISPVLDLSAATSVTLAFDHARKFGSNDQLSVKVTTDGTTWSDLTVSAWPDGSSWNYTSVTADLSAYKGNANVQIAFVYTSTSSAAPTWEIKNLVVSGKYNAATLAPVSLAGYPQVVTGTSFVVTGLEASTNYYYTITPKDGDESKEIAVTTKGTSTAVDVVTSEVVYYVSNDQLYLAGLENGSAVCLYDIAGRCLVNNQICSNNAIVTLPSAKGIYLFTISNGKQTQSYKIVK